jgi:hypothetical protein
MKRADCSLFSASDKELYEATIRFLGGRLEERDTLEWALSLGPAEQAKRLAVSELVGNKRNKGLAKHWLETWHLIVENWSRPNVERDSDIRIYQIRDRLAAHEYTKGVISELIETVTPRLKIRLVRHASGLSPKKTKKPKAREDLISCTLECGRIVDLGVFKLSEIDDARFLFLIASALDDLLVSSLDLARRIGWDDEYRYWIIGQINRVYYVFDDDDPDEFADGIAPAVKLIHQVIERLADVDINRAVSFVSRWKPSDSQIHLRLLSALYRDSRIASEEELVSFWRGLNDQQFWNLHHYPEVTELIARRFNDFSVDGQGEIQRRIKKGPPRSLFLHVTDKEELKRTKQYRAVMEMKRIVVAGGNLSKKYLSWLDEKLIDYPNLLAMDRIEEDFPDGGKFSWSKPMPDLRFDSLEGHERLHALEVGLSHRQSVFDNEGTAAAWISSADNAVKLISDFELTNGGSEKYSRVWESFGWAHTPVESDNESENRDNFSEVKRVLVLLQGLDIKAVEYAINGITGWLASWKKLLSGSSNWSAVWLLLWPIAESVTNAEKSDELADLGVTGRVVGDNEPIDLDTLNMPVGRLITVFFEVCPSLGDGDAPFASEGPLREMRQAIFSSKDRSLLIAQHRCVEMLGYFLRADNKWTIDNLITPLKAQNDSAVVLWRSISRRFQSRGALEIIGDEMLRRAVDLRLGRKRRRVLVQNLVLECLQSYWLERKPAISLSDVQQMIRSVEDEVRIGGADLLTRFLRDSSNPQKNTEDSVPSKEELYLRAVRPFLENVWPQEKSLVTPGVSKALADLPRASGTQFPNAVDAVERFLVPFDCWTMGDYGFSRANRDDLAFELIDSAESAESFLRLLDRTIGSHEGAIVPYELTVALEHIRKIDSNLSEEKAFRRLETLAR